MYSCALFVTILLILYFKNVISSSSDDDWSSDSSDSRDASRESGLEIETKEDGDVELIRVEAKSKKELVKLVNDSYFKERLKAAKGITIKTTTDCSVPIPKGPFYNFIVNICNAILTRFSSRKIEKYFKVLGKALKNLGSGYFMRKKIDEFRKTIKRLTAYRGRILRELVNRFLNIITLRTQMKYEFFEAMNSIFTVTEDNRLDDYIYDLKRYGDGGTKHIGVRTRSVFTRLVFRIFKKQEEHVRDDIKLKFKIAWVEYLERLHNKENYF